MKIIKEGDFLRQLRHFECPTCGCVFDAKRSEWSWNSQIHVGNTVINADPVANCPSCTELVQGARVDTE